MRRDEMGAQRRRRRKQPRVQENRRHCRLRAEPRCVHWGALGERKPLPKWEQRGRVGTGPLCTKKPIRDGQMALVPIWQVGCQKGLDRANVCLAKISNGRVNNPCGAGSPKEVSPGKPKEFNQKTCKWSHPSPAPGVYLGACCCRQTATTNTSNARHKMSCCPIIRTE
jgi:hypothetical protein